MIDRISVSAGSPIELGATPTDDGVNFAVFSANASRMTLCLFDENGAETQIDLPERDGDIWYGHISGVSVGQEYGYRADGPWAPAEGHRFNHNKLLLDPYARRVTGQPTFDPALLAYKPGEKDADLTFSDLDSAPFAPRGFVTDMRWPHFPTRPHTMLERTIIYEAHLKGLTMRHPQVGGGGTTVEAASDPILDHLQRLGITAIEFLPLQFFINDEFLLAKNLTNYWGYQPINYFAPDPRYLPGDSQFAVREMVDRFHEAGIEVLLDVVYNHTAEGGELGPSFSYRGLDNASYYRLLPDDPRYYVNDTGTGNTLACDNPAVTRLIMDSLRYWVTEMGVDGFRFDLGTVLGRREDGFDRDAPVLQAMRQDPVLKHVKLIMEPWDTGPGGYQVGGFTSPFLSWNDKFRDGVRRFWKGDDDTAPDFASRITGSALQYDHSGRRATSSVNFLTAHDGFTLQDTVSFNERHNEANGENNQDGHGDNHSDNMGAEGETRSRKIRAARLRRKANMMATLLLSQGTPMLLAGDELGNSQGGNNNAYCQDNDVGWIDWTIRDPEFLAFTQRLCAFRGEHPIIGQSRFLHSRERDSDGLEDLFWRRPDGSEMDAEDWDHPDLHTICVEMRMASGTPDYADAEYAVFMVFNRGGAIEVKVPEPPEGQVWSEQIDTSRPSEPPGRVLDGTIAVAENSVAVLVLEPSEPAE